MSDTDIQRIDWLNERRKGIGGSDAPKVLGVSKWGGPIDVYMRKVTAPTNDTQSEAAYWGHVLEDVVAKEFERRSGLQVEPHTKTEYSAEYPFMLANVDRVIVGENVGLECKTAHAMKAGEWSDDKIPDDYYVQVQHYCGVMRWVGCWIACLIGGQSFVYKYIPRNDVFIADMTAKEGAFWNEHVVPRIPPAPTVYDLHTADQDSGDVLTATQADMELAEKLFTVRKTIAEATEHKELLEAIFKERIGGRAGIKDICSWTQSKDRAITDWQKVAESLGASDELIAANTATKQGARVFRFKYKGVA